MPRQQTFDGPELDGVLARVRKEAGAEARILSASKVRAGGFGGFFSKESFRVVVELPDEAGAAPDGERLAFEPSDPRQLDQVAAPPSSLLELADLVDEAEAEAVHMTPALAPEPEPVAAAEPEPEPVAPPAGSPDREVAGEPPAPMIPVFRPAPYVPSTETPSFNAVLRRLTSEADASTEGHRDLVPDVVAPATLDTRPLTPSLRLPAMPGVTPEIEALVAALGLPSSLLPTDLSPAAAVIAMLHSLRLPEPPVVSTDPGALTVVVGERKAASALAHELAADAGIKRSNVRVADPASRAKSGLHDPVLVAEQRRSWDDTPRIVAVSAPLARTGLAWAWDVLAALEPSALWGVVGADRKCEDVEAWSAALGGFDALALTDLEETVSPAAMLELGIPVARLDGAPATPGAWASLLTARLAA